MSLFHKSHDETPAGLVSFQPAEAVIALLFLAVTADDKIAEAEEELVIAASDRMKLLRNLSIDDFNDAVYRIREAIKGSGRDAVFEAAFKTAPAELNDTIYALATDVVYSDGSAEKCETDLLRRIQEGLTIPDELATKIIEVIRIKNRG